MQELRAGRVDEESTEVMLSPEATEIEVDDDMSTIVEDSAVMCFRGTWPEPQQTFADAASEPELSQVLTDTGPAPRSPRRRPATDAYGYLARATDEREVPLVLDRSPGGTPLRR